MSETTETTETKTTAKKLQRTGTLDRPTVKALQKELSVKQTGVLDQVTVKALQELAAVEVTGRISAQNQLAEHAGTEVDPRAWRYTGYNAVGDNSVRFLQTKLGLPTTGLLDSTTVKALQAALNEGLSWA